MASLGKSESGAQARVDLSHVYDAVHTEHLQQTIIVVGLGETAVTVVNVAPRIGASAPAQDVEDNDAFDRRQVQHTPIYLDNHLRWPKDRIS